MTLHLLENASPQIDFEDTITLNVACQSDLGRLHQSHLGDLHRQGASWKALQAMHEINAQASTDNISLDLIAERMEGTAAFSMLATSRSCADVVATALRAIDLAREAKPQDRERLRDVARGIVETSIDYLAVAAEYSADQNGNRLTNPSFAADALIQLISSNRLTDLQKRACLKALSSGRIEWNEQIWSSVRSKLIEYCCSEFVSDDTRLAILKSPFYQFDYYEERERRVLGNYHAVIDNASYLDLADFNIFGEHAA